MTLLEKRDTLYNRPQILRLDAQWLNDLRYYLSAEQFDSLFDTEGGQSSHDGNDHYSKGTGHLSKTGAGHTLTSKLEEALHTRLSEMIALEQQSSEQSGHLHRLAAHQVTGIEAPKDDDSHYQVVYDYQPKYDPTLSSDARKNTPPETRKLAADVVIVAGGRNSALRQQFFNATEATSASPYGVASWANTRRTDKTQPKDENIQQMLVMREEFLTQYHSQLMDQLNPVSGTVGSYLSPAARRALVPILQLDEEAINALAPDLSQLSEQEDNSERQVLEQLHAQTKTVPPSETNIIFALQNAEGEVCQLRSFENRNTSYLGMEIPESVDRWLESVDEVLGQDNEIPTPERKAVMALLKQVWFQSAADSKGFDERYNARLENMDAKFTATFPVAQENLGQNYSRLHRENNDNSLLMLPVGDAAATPHFMSASGLSGGRATVDIATAYLHLAAQGRLPRNVDLILPTIDEAIGDVAGYVLAKGKDYLESMTPEKVEGDRRQNTLASLKAAANDKTQSFTLRPVRKKESFILTQGENRYELSVDIKGAIRAKNMTGGVKSNISSHPTLRHFVLTKL